MLVCHQLLKMFVQEHTNGYAPKTIRMHAATINILTVIQHVMET
jgi:hypothetical protein